jgi:hypothetical protein
MAPATLVDARALCHSRDFQRNVRSSLTMKVGLHRLRRRVHNSALADRDLFGRALDTHLYMDRVRLDRDWLIRKYGVLGGYREEEAGAGLAATSAISRSRSTSTRRTAWLSPSASASGDRSVRGTSLW